MTAREELEIATNRALAYVDNDQPDLAADSFLSDIHKVPSLIGIALNRTTPEMVRDAVRLPHAECEKILLGFGLSLSD